MWGPSLCVKGGKGAGERHAIATLMLNAGMTQHSLYSVNKFCTSCWRCYFWPMLFVWEICFRSHGAAECWQSRCLGLPGRVPKSSLAVGRLYRCRTHYSIPEIPNESVSTTIKSPTTRVSCAGGLWVWSPTVSFLIAQVRKNFRKAVKRLIFSLRAWRFTNLGAHRKIDDGAYNEAGTCRKTES